MSRARPSVRLHALALASLGLACNKLPTSLSGGDEAPADTPVAAPAPAPAPVAPPPSAGPATVDELLALVHEGSPAYAVFKDPAVLLGFAESAVLAYEHPVQAFGAAAGPSNQATELGQNFATFKAGVAEAKATLTQSGVDLARGIVVTDTGSGAEDMLLVFAAPSPEAAKTVLTALKLPDAATMTCQAAPARAGYVACAKQPAVLTAYKPGDPKALRAAAEAALPGVALDAVAMLGYDAEDRAHFGVTTPAGLGVVHVSAPADAAQAIATIEPGAATLLRFAQAGTGFFWARVDVAALRRQVPSLGGGLPGLDAVVGALTGEVLLGGSAEPAALQARVGLSDTRAVAGLPDLAVVLLGKQVPKTIPGVPGSKVVFEVKELTIGTEVTRALHVGVSGMPLATAWSEKLGLAPHAWVYAADNTLAVALGVDETGVARLLAPAAGEATVATLPPPLAEAIRAGQVGFIVHVPLDGLQSPALRQMLDEGFKAMPGYNPTLVQAGLGLLSPLSTMTLWMTEQGGKGVFNFSLQAIGHNADDEGKAALAAAAHADPVTAFTELAARYATSPRLTAYQTRAGRGGPGGLIGSAGPALMIAAGVGYALFSPAPGEVPAMQAEPVPADAPTEKRGTEKSGDKSGADKSGDKSGTDKSGTDKTGTDKTGTDKSGTEKSGTDKSGTDKSGTDKSGTDKSGTDKSGTDKSETDKAGTDKTGTGKTGSLQLDTSQLGTAKPPKRVGRGETAPRP